MILCADSGSTKTQWLTESGKLIETIGLNPQFHTSESILSAIQANANFDHIKDEITQVYFYGAGCSSNSRNAIVSQALGNFFTNAKIAIDHDLKAAAYATYNGETCISCIIGTGSNSCLFDGKNITESVPALGYILGDEGSGSWLGKELLKLFLYHLLPPATETLLKKKYGVEKEKVFQHVYRETHANVYLASFAKVLSETSDTDFAINLVAKGFAEFFKYHVACYPAYQKYPVHFVGSLAFNFKTQLQQVAHNYGVELGTIDHAPVHKLLSFHLKNFKQN